MQKLSGEKLRISRGKERNYTVTYVSPWFVLLFLWRENGTKSALKLDKKLPCVVILIRSGKETATLFAKGGKAERKGGKILTNVKGAFVRLTQRKKTRAETLFPVWISRKSRKWLEICRIIMRQKSSSLIIRLYFAFLTRRKEKRACIFPRFVAYFSISRSLIN